MSEEAKTTIEKPEGKPKLSTAFFMAWGNFLVLPCPHKVWDSRSLKTMLAMLPAVGLIVGLLEFGLCYLMRRLMFPISVSAFIMTLFVFGISGFMHADGFMDVCDAVLSRRDLEERQRILKDSHVGAFAVVSMILMALGTFAAFLGIAEREMATIAISYTVTARLMPILNILSLISIPVISRAVAGACVLGLKPLETSQYAEEKSDRSRAKGYIKVIAIVSLIIFLALLGVTVLLAARISTQAIWIFIFRLTVPTVSALLATRLFAELARRNLNGMSGDIAGFSICMGELIGLLVLAFILYRLI